MNNQNNIDKNHNEKRAIFRVLGPLVLGIGIILILIAFIDFFKSTGDPFGRIGGFNSGPTKFGYFFVGIPFVFVGSVLCSLGYGGSVARYQAGEMAPIAKDTFNYMAEGTSQGVKTVVQSVQEGINQSNINTHRENGKACPNCHTMNDYESKFCKNCASSLVTEKKCSYCGETNDIDAKFCKNCANRF